MFNLLNGEFYKIRKTQKFYNCLVIGAVFILFIYLMLFLVEKIQNDEMQAGPVGVTVTSENADAGLVFGEIGVLDVIQQVFAGGFAAIVTSVFACIFVIGEFTNGAVKNYVGKGYTRGHIFLAKYIAVLAATAVIEIFMVAVGVISGFIFIGTDGINAAFFQDLAVYTGAQLILGAGINSLMVLIGECSRNMAAGISISLGISLFSVLLFEGLDLLLHGTSIRPSDYWVLSLSMNCPAREIGSSFIMHSLAAGVITAAAALFAGMFHFKKADVK